MEVATVEFAHRMLERANTLNVVQVRVEQQNLCLGKMLYGIN